MEAGTKPESVTWPEQLERFDELRSLFSPRQSVAVLDDFSKWLFGAAAIAGSLGGAFGVTGLTHLQGAGKTLFALSILCLGVSLALATLARIPIWVRHNPYSPDSLERAFQDLGQLRGNVLRAGGLLFGAALVLAALAPLFS